MYSCILVFVLFKIYQVKDSFDTPIIFAGNKCDLVDNAEKQITNFKREMEPNECYLTSAKTGYNVDEIFHNMCRQLIIKFPSRKSKKHDCILI